MSNDATRANAERVPEINRRKFLANTSMAIASASAVTVIAEADAMEPTDRIAELQSLIDAHTAAHIAFIAAIDAEQAADDAYFETHPETIPVTLTDGYVIDFDVNYNFQQYVDMTKKRIADHYASKRRVIERELKGDPAAIEAAAASLRAAEKTDQNMFRKIVAAEMRERRKSGFQAAVAARDAVSDGETEAAVALLTFMCLTVEEIKLRAAYIVGGDRNSQGRLIYDSLTCGNGPEIDALLGVHLLEGGEA